MGIDNTCTISGNLGADPELRFTPSGAAVATFSVAVYAGKDKDANWFDVTAWTGNYDQQAENIAETLRKGDRVTVYGRLVQDRWEDDHGNKRSKVKIVADDVSLSLRRASAEVTRNERRTGPTPDESERNAYADVPQFTSESAAPAVASEAYPEEEPF